MHTYWLLTVTTEPFKANLDSVSHPRTLWYVDYRSWKSNPRLSDRWMTTLPPEPQPPRRVCDCSSGETILSSILCLKISAWQDNHMMRWRTADHNCTLTCNYCVEEQSWLCVGRWTSPAITRPNEKAAFNRCFVRLPLLYIMNLTMCIWTPLTGRCLSVGSSVGSSSKCYRIITLVAKLWSFSRVVCVSCASQSGKSELRLKGQNIRQLIIIVIMFLLCL